MLELVISEYAELCMYYVKITGHWEVPAGVMQRCTLKKLLIYSHWCVNMSGTPFSKITITFGAGLISVVIKELSSDHQKRPGDDAAWQFLGRVRMFDHTTLLNSYKTVCDTVLA